MKKTVIKYLIGIILFLALWFAYAYMSILYFEQENINIDIKCLNRTALDIQKDILEIKSQIRFKENKRLR